PDAPSPWPHRSAAWEPRWPSGSWAIGLESRHELQLTAPGTRAPAPQRRAPAAKNVAGADELADHFEDFVVVEAEEGPGALRTQTLSRCGLQLPQESFGKHGKHPPSTTEADCIAPRRSCKRSHGDPRTSPVSNGRLTVPARNPVPGRGPGDRRLVSSQPA